MHASTSCVGADVHLQEITLRAVEVIAPCSVTKNCWVPNLPSVAETASRLGYTHVEIGYEATGMLWIPFHLSSTLYPPLGNSLDVLPLQQQEQNDNRHDHYHRGSVRPSPLTLEALDEGEQTGGDWLQLGAMQEGHREQELVPNV